MSDAATPDKSFEKALADLEGVVRKLEDGTTGLDEALAEYERGIGLLKSCYRTLQQAEQRILSLAGTDEDGRPILELFEHTAALAAERPITPRRRKSGERDLPEK